MWLMHGLRRRQFKSVVPLITDNPRDFELIQGLEIVTVHQ